MVAAGFSLRLFAQVKTCGYLIVPDVLILKEDEGTPKGRRAEAKASGTIVGCQISGNLGIDSLP